MNEAQYNPDGGPIEAEIRSAFAYPGAYTMRFWEANSNSFFQDPQEGNFINDDDDRYRLVGEAAEQEERVVDCITTLRLIDLPADYRTELRIYQDGEVIGDDVLEGTYDATTVTMRQFIILKALTS